MDPRTNPYAPGAGAPPPDMTGRDDIIESTSIALDRMRAGLVARSVMLVGLRGVGKTVLLNRLHNEAEAKGFASMMLEAPEKRSLPALLAPSLRAVLLKLDRIAAGGDLAKRALRSLGGFVQAMKLKYADIEFGLDLGLEPGVADTGDLDADLISLFPGRGRGRQGAQDRARAVHRRAAVRARRAAGRAHHRAAPLRAAAAAGDAGGRGPAAAGGADGARQVVRGAPVRICRRGAAARRRSTRGHQRPGGPLGREVHQARARRDPAPDPGLPLLSAGVGQTQLDLRQAVAHRPGRCAPGHANRALADLDASFFRVRLDRLSPSEKRYLRAMAELGPGPHRSGDIAQTLGREVQTVAPIRAKLIEKGMVYSPSHGDTGFTVPLFDAFMRRVLPTLEAL